MTFPSEARRSFVRTNAPPLPGLTCWNSRTLKTVPSTSMWLPFLSWLVEITADRLVRIASPPMPRRYVHTCLRVLDPDVSVRFYLALGFEERGRLNFETAYNIYLGLPGDGDVLELTVNRDRDEPYDVGEGYNHMALAVEDIHAALFDLEPV